MATYTTDPSSLGDSTNIETVEMYSEAEDEIDQLDSDSEVDEQETESSLKKNGLPGSGERIPGHSLLPALRLENIIQADGVTGNLSLSKEGLFILSVATEEFIKRMAEAGQMQASLERRTTINYCDMAATTRQYQEFMFLNDTIPAPLTLSEALQMRESKEKELFDQDPALSASTSLHPSTSVSAPTTGRNKTKSRATNGIEKRNGSASTSRHEKRSDSKGRHSHDETSVEAPIDVDGESEWADGQAPSRSSSVHHRPAHNGTAPVSTARPPLVNGHNSAAPSRSGTNTPARSRDDIVERSSPFHSRSSPLVAPEETWSGQFAVGPASGFLQGPGGPFSRVAQNPGRTIYSQQHRAD